MPEHRLASRIEPCAFHGLPALRLTHAGGASATVTLHGAHVVSWTSPAGVEQLYLSPKAVFAPGQPIRGGVPVVFPQFNMRGPLPRHGFARTHAWELQDEDAAACRLTLALPAHPAIRALWPHAFACTLTVALQDTQLALTLQVHNQGDTPLRFQAALHTYLAVGHIDSVRLDGLDASRFADCTVAGGGAVVDHQPVQPRVPTDRIYFNAPAQLQLHSALGALALQHDGFNDVVVWNPGDDAASCPPDLAPDGYLHFLCVEAARIGEPVELVPGQHWSGAQTLRAAR